MGSGVQQRRTETRISWRTLMIASVASVAAAFVVSSLWAPGTLIGAAVTPVIVALVSELVRKPIEAVPAPSAALAPLLSRSGDGPAPAGQEGEDEVRAAPIDPPEGEPEPAADTAAAAIDPGSEPADRAAATGEPAPHRHRSAHRRHDAAGEPVVREYARSDYRTWDRRRIKLALVTGALAFAIAVAFFVVADLTTGSAVTGRGGGSSLFSPRKSSDGGSRPATTTTTPGTTTTQQQTTPTAPPAERTTEQPPATTETQPPDTGTTEQPPAQRTAPTPAAPPADEAVPQQQTTP